MIIHCLQQVYTDSIFLLTIEYWKLNNKYKNKKSLFVWIKIETFQNYTDPALAISIISAHHLSTKKCFSINNDLIKFKQEPRTKYK